MLSVDLPARRRAIVVDDEEPGRANVRYALAEHPHWQLCGEFDGAASALAFLARHAVDLVFLDVRMPRADGLTLARALCRAAQPPLIVFVTAHDVHAVDAFEVHALDYLLKPFDDARLAATLARAEAQLLQRQRAAQGDAVRARLAGRERATPPAPYWTQVEVRSVGCIERILLAHVDWIASAGNYVELHVGARTVLYRIPIGRLEAHLDPRAFVRTHRRCIVRIDGCRRLSGAADGAHVLTLACGAAVPVSGQCLQRVRACLATR